MRVALDATTSIGGAISGVGVYARELLNGLAARDPDSQWEWFYRSQRYWRAVQLPKPANVTRRFLTDSFGNRESQLFHGLNQRLPRRRFRKQIVTFHDLFVLSGEYSTRDFRERFAAQARGAAAAADLVIAVSAFTASQVESLLNVGAGRIRVIHHGITVRPIPARRRENVVLCVGAVQRRKNQARLVRAFRVMPQGWSLVLAGSHGFESEETLREIAASPRASDIHVTGYQTDDQIAEWYARAGIFAFPSLDEGFGMPVLEAMAAKIPVIAGDRSALPEVCGGAALLIDPTREDELADAMLLLAKDEDRRKQLVERGILRADEFGWAKTVEETAAAYRKTI